MLYELPAMLYAGAPCFTISTLTEYAFAPGVGSETGVGCRPAMEKDAAFGMVLWHHKKANIIYLYIYIYIFIYIYIYI